jgi:hypothetical protein
MTKNLDNIIQRTSDILDIALMPSEFEDSRAEFDTWPSQLTFWSMTVGQAEREQTCWNAC